MIKCSVDGCDRKVRYVGLCGMHYKRKWRHGDPTTRLIGHVQPCAVENCPNDTSKGAMGLCGTHYIRFSKHGRFHKVVNRGSGWTMDTQGYIVLFLNGQRKYEHIHLAEKALGKPLPKGAIVHHMNKKPWDNETPFNLIVCPDQAYHLLLHRRMKELGYGQSNPNA